MLMVYTLCVRRVSCGCRWWYEYHRKKVSGVRTSVCLPAQSVVLAQNWVMMLTACTCKARLTFCSLSFCFTIECCTDATLALVVYTASCY